MTTTVRLSPVKGIRFQSTPYIAFSPATRYAHAHGHPEAAPRDWIKLNKGHGSRHDGDRAPFSLWDEATQDYREPSDWEMAWLEKEFKAEVITQWPMIILETNHPPNPLPLTVACVAAVFIPRSDELANPHEPQRIRITNNYANAQLEDPMPFKLPKWKNPTESQMVAIGDHMLSLMGVRAITYIWPSIIVELYAEDGKTYGDRTLPGRVGGCGVVYYHKADSYWTAMTSHARERLITPSSTTQDTTNYAINNLHMTPGVRLASSGFTQTGKPTQSLATSAGILVQKEQEGDPHLTVAYHGFSESNDVYHPSPETGLKIGEVTERAMAQDVDFVRLNTSIRFANYPYFEAQAPKRILRYADIVQGAWYAADGMSTGKVAFFAIGARNRFPPRPDGHVRIPNSRWSLDTAWTCTGATGGGLRDGLCGAPLVHEDETNGGVAGFFQLAGQTYAFCPTLDWMIDRGWKVSCLAATKPAVKM
ncbi:MAG: hypothetical protein M1836_006022 [Candelina mexicana]|nr:MAG: hypothetical protein M1836_006022 [Candelina mexicana]